MVVGGQDCSLDKSSFYSTIKFLMGYQSSTVVSSVASHQEGSWFKPAAWLEPFCVEFLCSPGACVGVLSGHSTILPR